MIHVALWSASLLFLLAVGYGTLVLIGRMLAAMARWAAGHREGIIFWVIAAAVMTFVVWGVTQHPNRPILLYIGLIIAIGRALSS